MNEDWLRFSQMHAGGELQWLCWKAATDT